jgi:hypothetical protein
MKKRPTKIYGKCGKKSFIAKVTPSGDDWEVRIEEEGRDPEFRYVSTLQARPDNGALKVSQMLRRDYNITGIFATR